MTKLNNLSDKTLLVILDGFGISDNDRKNAVKDAKTPNFNKLFSNYPFTTIEAGGVSVGLPKGVVGNSEVGHMNLGAGRPVRQDLVRINEAIDNNSLKDMEKFIELKNSSNRIHLMGLLSDGGVHSHINHLIYIAKNLINDGKEVFFHAFMDGRDTQRDVGEKYLIELEKVKGLKIASMQGRSIGMDRDRRWEKIKSAYDTFLGKAEITSESPREWLKKEYKLGRYDEFVNPVLFNEDYSIKKDDSIFFINFRPDRAIQLSLAFNDPEFKEFDRDFIAKYFLCMTPYIPDDVDLPILFDKEKLEGVMSDYLSKLGKRQFKIAETEKYAHVTYFFNGGNKQPHDNEEFVLVPSPKDCKTYDEKPQMSAFEVCDKLLDALDKDYTFYLVNFANGDMVGHTGNYEAAVKAIEVLDECVGKLMKKCEDNNITMILTADHGNSDMMVYEDGTPHTSHTGSPVPFSVFHKDLENKQLQKNEGEFALKDVSPTVLNSLGIELPPIFEGKSVFV